MSEKTSSSKNIYAYNILKSVHLSLENEYSFLLSRLINIKNKINNQEIQMDHLAEYIMDAFNKSQKAPYLSRVCLSLAYPHSRKLAVVTSINDPKIGDNNMKAHYSCYVSSITSLNNTATGNIRIYNDINLIINSYHSQKRPVQRSIGNIHKMGIQSGLTLPFYLNPLVTGFLFLNSDQKDNFEKFNDQDYFVLCTLHLLLTNVFTSYMQEHMVLKNHFLNCLSKIKIENNIFVESQFLQQLIFLLMDKKGTSVQPSCKNNIKKSFFYPSTVVSYILACFLEDAESIINLEKLVIELNESEDHKKVVLAFTLPHSIETHLKKNHHDQTYRNFVGLFDGQLEVHQNRVELALPLEVATADESKYQYSCF